jgi:hypothetical protein
MIEAIIGRLSPSKTKEMGKPVYFCTACGHYIYKERDEWKLCKCAKAIVKESENTILLKVKPELRDNLEIRTFTDDEGRPFTDEEIEEFKRDMREWEESVKITPIGLASDDGTFIKFEDLKKDAEKDVKEEPKDDFCFVDIIDYLGESKHWLDDHWLDERMDFIFRFSSKEKCKLVFAFLDTLAFYLKKDLYLEDLLIYAVKELLEKLEAEGKIDEFLKSESKRYQKVGENLRLMLEDARKFWEHIEKRDILRKQKAKKKRKKKIEEEEATTVENNNTK